MARELRHVHTFEFEGPTMVSVLTAIRSKLADLLADDESTLLLSVTPTYDNDEEAGYEAGAWATFEAAALDGATMTDDLLAKIEVPHTEAPELPDYHEWVDVWLLRHEKRVGQREVWRDSLGRKHRHGRDRWRRWCCNNPTCDGVLLVNMRAVEKMVTAEVDGDHDR